MKFELQKKDAEILSGLVYLGNVVVNENRFKGNAIAEYARVAEEIYRQYLAQTEGKRAPTDNEIAAVRERAIDAVGGYLDEYLAAERKS